MRTLGFLDYPDLSELSRGVGLLLKVLLAMVGTALGSLATVGLVGLIASRDKTPKAPRPPEPSVRRAQLWEGETYGRVHLR